MSQYVYSFDSKDIDSLFDCLPSYVLKDQFSFFKVSTFEQTLMKSKKKSND